KVSQREAARIVATIARAIHSAHQQGVLHRDLKPSNILIDEQGEPHVMDFGLAKQHTSDIASLTHTGAVLGTPAYLAPEQAAGNRRQVGPGVDVYSLGTILYHMITGRPPFQADSPVEMVMMVREQDPPTPRSVAPGVERDLEMITLRCLQKPPDLRYATAADLAADLEAYLKDESISARSGRLAQVVSRLFRETHHAPVLENWGLLWMWHSLVLFSVCLCTQVLVWTGDFNRWHYVWLWIIALWGWAGIFWTLRKKMGPVLFIERQIAHVWAASMIAIAGLFPLEYALGLQTLTLSPALPLVTSTVFIVKAGMLSGTFYFHAAALLLTSAAMVIWKDYSHLLFGIVSAATFFFPGLKYYRRGRI
ncbi:MAG: serine/threonine protein kinase, partial [Planctomycetales bacterium]|nr:serine/threonine protein kinase [Planctomycetales bacterium]